MADLRVKSTGKEFRRIDEGTAKLLEELFPENIERINPTHQRPVAANAAGAVIANPQKPIWGIFTAPISGNVSISCKYLRGEHWFDGPPERAAAFSVCGHMCPLEVVDEYRRLKTKGSPEDILARDEARRVQEAEALENQYREAGTKWAEGFTQK